MKRHLLRLAASSLLLTLIYAGMRYPAEAQFWPQRELVVQKGSVSILPSSAKRFALIIGVDLYDDTQINRLEGASNDAKTLANVIIKSGGFPKQQVMLLTSDQQAERRPTRGNILRRLSNLRALVPKDGLLLVSFAGHGIERNGQAYLLPTDAQVSGDLDLLEQTAINAELIRNWIRQSGVGQVLVILDACRNNPSSARGEENNPLTEAYTRGFSFDIRNREITAFATLYATEIGDVAYEYKERKQGYFTWALVEGLNGAAADEKGAVTLAGLIKYLQEEVPKRVLIDLGLGKKQRPFAVIEGYKADELVLTVINLTSTSVAVHTSKLKPAIGEYLTRGDRFGVEGKWGQAESEYRHATELEPNNALAHFYLGVSRQRQQKWEEAEAALKKAVELEPSNDKYYVTLGQSLIYENAGTRSGSSVYKKPKLQEAEAAYREAIRLNPKEPWYHIFLADVLLRNARPLFEPLDARNLVDPNLAEAEKQIREAIRLDPKNQEFQKRLEFVQIYYKVLRKPK